MALLLDELSPKDMCSYHPNHDVGCCQPISIPFQWLPLSPLHSNHFLDLVFNLKLCVVLF